MNFQIKVVDNHLCKKKLNTNQKYLYAEVKLENLDFHLVDIYRITNAFHINFNH